MELIRKLLKESVDNSSRYKGIKKLLEIIQQVNIKFKQLYNWIDQRKEKEDEINNLILDWENGYDFYKKELYTKKYDSFMKSAKSIFNALKECRIYFIMQ